MKIIINIDVPELGPAIEFYTRALDGDTAERAVAAGATRETDYVDWRGSRCISFGDPFGHGFCFIQFERNATYD